MTYPQDLKATDKARYDRRWDDAHAGHQIAFRERLRRDGRPVRHCLTCARKDEVDDVAVQRAVTGDFPVRLNRTERHKAVEQLRPSLSGALIAQRLGVTDRTIWRDLAEIRSRSASKRS